MGATFTHLLIWNYDDMKEAWNWITPSGIRSIWNSFTFKFWKDDGMRDADNVKSQDESLDPHYREMLKASPFNSGSLFPQ
jgi:hypothetical protein